MKRFFTLVCLVLCAFTLAVISFAHPGGTDGSGGHYNHDTGEYHYHHGYPEHQHPDGVCPYSYGDTTSESTTLFSLEDFTFEYKEFTPVVPEYPSIGDYTLPEVDSTENSYSPHYETPSTTSPIIEADDIWNFVKLLFGGILVGLYASFCILGVFGIGHLLPEKAIKPTVIAICIITIVIVFIVKG